MYLTVNGHKTYCYTGSKPFNPAQPTVVFIHGVLNDHSVWILQSRYLAHHGYNVLAIDLPGHGKSAGDAPRSVAEASAFIAALIQASGAAKATLVGHSWGSLIALHTAAHHPELVDKLALVGTAFPMKVSPALLDASLSAPDKAIEMVNTFSHSTIAPPPSTLGPGTWLYGGSRALMRRVLASNTTVNVFHRGFTACDSYASGEADMALVKCPTLFVLGRHDQMTPPKAAQSLVKAAHRIPHHVAVVDGGHAMMSEAPDEVLFALAKFLT